MKFTWKMIAVVAILLALSLCICGTVVIAKSFSSMLSREKFTAKEELNLYSLTVQALCNDALRKGDLNEARHILQEINYNTQDETQKQFLVCTANGYILAGTPSLLEESKMTSHDGKMELRIYEKKDNSYLLAVNCLSVYGTELHFVRSVSIEPIFQRCADDLRGYELIMVIVLVIALALTMLLCFYMTEPIRRISRAAKQFSEGKYDKRAQVSTDDEIGHLARSFNSMADSLEAKIYQLEDAAQRQKEFNASFAHELKTPLTSVIGYADTIRSCKLNAKQQMEAANFIFTEGKRLEAMSFALLELFALEEKKPAFEEVNIQTLVSDVRKSSEYLLKERGVRLTIKVRKYSITAAPELLKTLLYNLIDNARKASEENAEILVIGEPVENGYLLSVCDFGRGIPRESLDRLTEPFYMVDKSRARAQGGAGLGLALCRKIAQLHGSELHFESEPGKGTVVSFVVGGSGNEP